MSSPYLNATDIYKDYRLGPGIELSVLKGASMSISRGEFVAIMGSSGSGKSTLLHVLGALDRPTRVALVRRPFHSVRVYVADDGKDRVVAFDALPQVDARTP